MKSLFIALSLLLISGSALAFIGTTNAPFEIRGDSTKDQSVSLQAALNQAKKNGGDTVLLPAGTIYAQGLALPGNVTLSGQGIGATVLKLPDDANTWLLASLSFVRNQAWSDMYGGIENMTLDGNKGNNKTGDLLVIKSYRLVVRNCQFMRSPRHAVLISAVSKDGTLNKINLMGQ